MPSEDPHTANLLPVVSPSNNEVQDAKQTGTKAVPDPWTVEKALKTFGLPTPTTPPRSPIAFFHLIERLKTTRREGWRRFGITHGESISDHMYRMAILTTLAPESLSTRLDISRCTHMALVHDMAEALVGDITPVDGISKTEKSRRETDTIEYIGTQLLGQVPAGGAAAGQRLIKVWREYEDDETDEAHFVHDIDKIELVLQMVEYEKANTGRTLDLGEFAWVAKKVRLPEMKRWCAELMAERQAFWEAQGRHDIPGLEIGKELIAEVQAMEPATNGHAE